MQIYDVVTFFILKAKIGREVKLTNGCIVGAKCEIFTNEVLAENTVIFGSDNRRRISNEKPQVRIKYYN
jgi:dynactin-6